MTEDENSIIDFRGFFIFTFILFALLTAVIVLLLFIASKFTGSLFGKLFFAFIIGVFWKEIIDWIKVKLGRK